MSGGKPNKGHGANKPSADPERENASVKAAEIAARGAIIVAIIGVIGVLITGLFGVFKSDSGEGSHVPGMSASTAGSNSPAVNMYGTTTGNNSPNVQVVGGATNNLTMNFYGQPWDRKTFATVGLILLAALLSLLIYRLIIAGRKPTPLVFILVIVIAGTVWVAWAVVAFLQEHGQSPTPKAILEVSTNVLDFGEVLAAPGSTATNAFTISNAGGGVLNGIAGTLPPFSILSGTNYNLRANQTQLVTVVFDAMQPMVSTNNFVTLTGGGGQSVRLTVWPKPLPPVSLRVNDFGLPASAGPILNVSTNALDFGAVEFATTNSFTVSNAGGGILTGTATTRSPFFVLSGMNYSLGPNQTQLVTVVFDATQPMASTNNFVTLTGGGGGSVKLAVSKVSQGPTDLRVYDPEAAGPVLFVSPDTLNFEITNPVVSIAHPSLRSSWVATNYFTVSNAGGGILTGTASTWPPYGILSGANYSLRANQTQRVAVGLNQAGPDPAMSTTNVVKLTGGTGGSVKLNFLGPAAPVSLMAQPGP